MTFLKLSSNYASSTTWVVPLKELVDNLSASLDQKLKIFEHVLNMINKAIGMFVFIYIWSPKFDDPKLIKILTL